MTKQSKAQSDTYKQELAASQARMQEMRAKIQAEHDGSPFNSLSSDYWKIINAYLPKPQKA